MKQHKQTFCIFFCLVQDYNQNTIFISFSRLRCDGTFECCTIFPGKSRHGRGGQEERWRIVSRLIKYATIISVASGRHVVFPRRFVTLRNGPYLVPSDDEESAVRKRWIFALGNWCAVVARPRVILYTSLNMQELFPCVLRHVVREIVRVKRRKDS